MPAFLSGIWVKLCIAGAFIGLLLVAALKLISIGRKAEQGEAATKGMQRTQQANAVRQRAEQPVSKEIEDADPNNRDR